MYKYYNKNGYKIMEYEFDSISEFIDYLDDNKVNTNIFGKNPESEIGTYDFCKTHSLEEAKQLCKYGYHEDFDKLVELKIQLEKYIKKVETKSKQYNFYVGYAPDVKAYLEGNPLSMFMKDYSERKHIDIYYNSSVLSEVSTSQIFNRGAITLCIVEILESMGFSVGLHIHTMTSNDDQIHYAKFNLKKSDEHLNIQKLYFPLCGPSFLRRLVFRLMEETPDIYSSWSSGYGYTANEYMTRKIIDLKPNDIVICQPEEMNVRGYDIVDDANSMFEYINSLSNHDFELEHIDKQKRL